MIAFIKEHREVCGVEPICRVLQIAPSTFYAHLAVEQDPELVSDRAKRDAELRPRMKQVWEENRSVYGDLWAYHKGVGLDFSRPGKPTDNAFIEAFNGKFRQECLNTHWFMSLADAAEKLETWRRYCNEERPHSAIGNKSPIILVKSEGETSPPI